MFVIVFVSEKSKNDDGITFALLLYLSIDHETFFNDALLFHTEANEKDINYPSECNTE